MSSQPRVSVIVPTRDREEMLRRAIRSVRSQGREDLELLIVDDGSQRPVEASVRDLLHPGDRVIRNDPPLGGAGARNRGIEQARAELIAFLDDDDEWLPGKLTRQIDLLAHCLPEVDMVYCAYRYRVTETGEEVAAPVPHHRGDVRRICLRQCLTPTSTALVRKRAIEVAGGFDVSLPAGQEWDLWIRLSRHGQFDFVPQVGVRMHVHGRQISSDLERVIRARRQILDKYRADYEREPALLADQLLRMGLLHHLAHEPTQGRRLLLNALRREPKLRTAMHLILSLLPPLHRRLIVRFGMFRAGPVVFYH